MALLIEIKAADGTVSRTRLEAGRNRFSVRLGDSYRILDDQTGLTPDGVAVKRVDNNLIVDGLDRSGTTVEFPEFYNVCSAGSPCELTVQTGSGSAPVSITPGTQPIGALADGAFVLYDPNFAETAPPAPSLGDGTIVRNVLYGVGGLAVVGLAAGGGGGGGGGGGDTGNRPDGSLKMTSSQFVNTRAPTITGEGEPGSRVIVRIDTDGDGVPNVTYGTTVAADFTWSINLATAVPESGVLPAGGLPNASNVGITSTSSTGIVSLPTFVLAYDGTPPVPAVINAVATDNVVNASEKQNGFVVSGSAEPGSTVVLSLGAQVLATVAVRENGQWQTEPLAGNTVPADGSYVLSTVVQDRAGNLSAPATSSLSVNTAPPPLLNLSVAGGDGIVAINDSASVVFSGRTDPNSSVQVQWNDRPKPVTADGSGNWTLAYTGLEVPDSSGAAFGYSIIATNPVGNSIEQTGQIFVDRQAPAAPVIGIVEGDDTVTPAERTNGVPVTGQGEAGARVDVAWGAASRSANIDGNGQWAVQFSAGDVPGVASPGGPTTVTATAVDAVGNSASSQRVVTVEQPFLAPTIANVEVDNVVNATEAGDNVPLTGSVQAGVGGVSVTWGASFSAAAVVSGSTWSVSVPAAQVPGDGSTTVTATITGAGGGAATNRAVTVDKTPPPLPAVDPVEGDNVISNVERADGVVVSGQAEAGAAINVVLGAASAATVANTPGGGWSVTFASAQIPPGPGTVTLGVTASDAAGNTSTPHFRDITLEGPAAGAPPSSDLFGSAAAPHYPGISAAVDSLLAVDLQAREYLA